MSFSLYEPEKLNKVARDLSKKKDARKNVVVRKNEQLHKLVSEFSSLEEWQLSYHISALSQEELYMLAGYIPHNYWDVNLANFRALFTDRANQQMCDILYREWQDNFDNKEINQFILTINNCDILFSARLNPDNRENTFFKVLQSENILYEIGALINEKNFSRDIQIEDRIERVGVNKNSELADKLNYMFFSYCGKNDILWCSNYDLYHLFARYKSDYEILVSSVEHMISLLTNSELKRYAFFLKFVSSKIKDSKVLQRQMERIEKKQPGAEYIREAEGWNLECKNLGDAIADSLRNYYYSNYAQFASGINDISERKLGTEMLLDLYNMQIMNQIDNSGIISDSIVESFTEALVKRGKDRYIARKMVLIMVYAYGIRFLGLPSEIDFRKI